jgi:hypothetical protein
MISLDKVTGGSRSPLQYLYYANPTFSTSGVSHDGVSCSVLVSPEADLLSLSFANYTLKSSDSGLMTYPFPELAQFITYPSYINNYSVTAFVTDVSIAGTHTPICGNINWVTGNVSFYAPLDGSLNTIMESFGLTIQVNLNKYR